MIVPDMEGSSHIPPAPMPEVLQNPRYVGSWRTIPSRLLVRAAVYKYWDLQFPISW